MITFKPFSQNVRRSSDDKRNASCKREFDCPHQGRGLTPHGVPVTVDDVVILQDVADVARARAWLGSDDLKAEMQKSGVVGSPNVRFAAAALA